MARPSSCPNRKVGELIEAAGSVGRNRLRDSTLILVSYRHGLRVSEAIDLRWEQVDLKLAILHVRRLRNGAPSTHPLGKEECRVLSELRHACGYKLANDGQDTCAIQSYLGHRNINHTVRYTELSPERFRGFWKD